MKQIRNYCLFALCSLLIVACKSKKKSSVSGENPVEIGDFIDFFPLKTVPYQFGDTTLNKKENDSTIIAHKVFSQFVPDSLMGRLIGRGEHFKIYPMGRIKASGSVKILFVKAVGVEKRAALAFAFNKKDQLTDGIQLLRYGQYANAQQSMSIDKSFSINKTITRRNSDGSFSDGKDVYGLDNSTGKFQLIMTDPLDDVVSELVNPIDDFPKKQKYAADYTAGKLNLVSIRDGRKPDRVSFFIHFDHSEGSCTGELKGEAVFKSPTIAEYREGGDPCVLRFIFGPSAVSLKEQEGCGSHRGLRCSFDGSYARKKQPKPLKKVSTKKK